MMGALMSALCSDQMWCLPQEGRAYYKLRLERSNARHVGLRAKRVKEAAAEEKAKAK